MRLFLALVALLPSFASAVPPQARIYTHMGMAAVLGDEAPASRSNFSENGFTFELARIELLQPLGDQLQVILDAEFTENGVFLDNAAGVFHSLPGGLAVKAGLFGTRMGYVNEGSPAQRRFVDQPLALGKFFGDHEQRALGVEVSAVLPMPWRLELLATAMRASGNGQRSWFGDAHVEPKHPRDFAYLLSAKNRWEFDSVALDFSIDGVLGPNDSGRKNASNVLGGGLMVTIFPKNTESGMRAELETEWYLRRRQIPGGAHQDLAGWGSLAMHFLPHWGVAARYEFTQGVKNDPLDPADDRGHHRATMQVAWKPLKHMRLRLMGRADVGGSLEKGDKAFTTLLHLEVGAL